MVTEGGIMKSTFKNISQEKQKAIIQGAFEEFGRYGYQNASTNRLVKTLGISKGSIFKYFDGKLDLYSYLVDIAVDKLTTHMTEFSYIDACSPIENIIEYAEHEYNYLVANPREYWFFYMLSRELNLVELDEIKSKLVNASHTLSSDMYTRAGLINDSGLHKHLNLIISSYNRIFLESMGQGNDWVAQKPEYLSGLRNHLSYVKWR
tara:strand:- start:214 stop:831 length:618 start_codon:yes stop_codon:yes gene_type:complete